jgi:hypothetical protein
MTQTKWLIFAAIVTVVLWHLPGGNYVLYPFTILATWCHEMSHGLMALLLGGDFRGLQIFPDGSGLAQFAYPTTWGPIKKSLVAAAGPMGPPIAGFLFLLASSVPKTASFFLKALGVSLLLTSLLYIRSPFGLAMIIGLGIVILAISIKATEEIRAFTIRFLGVQACISTYYQVGYLFSYSAGPLGLSDTAQIQQSLLLPYWFWGGLLSLLSFLLLALGLKMSYPNRNDSLRT